MKYTTERTDLALARATKALLGMDLTRDQMDGVLNVIRDLVVVVSIDVADTISASILNTVKRNIERRASEAT